MSDDDILTPVDLHREHPRWGLQFQRAHRQRGDFIPFVRVGNRIFYRRSSVNKFLEEMEQQGNNDDVS